MAARSWIPLLAAAIIAVVCVRLGLWQLDRREQRRARNATIAAAFQDPPISAEQALIDSVPRFRRVTVRGRWEYSRETTISGRTRNGAPGVHIVTPLILENGTEIPVNRGWVYSPDARTVGLARWREGDRGEFDAYVDEPPPSLRGGRQIPRYVVALADTASGGAAGADRPARLPAPAFGDEGPHLNYAVQWFSFAAIALIGAPIVVRRQRRRE